MKKGKQNLTLRNRLRDMKFEAELARETSSLHRTAEKLGRKHGRSPKHQPGASADSIMPFIEVLVRGFESLKSKVRTHIFSSHSYEWLQSRIQNAKERLGSLNKEAEQKRNLVEDLKDEHADMQPPYDEGEVKNWNRLVWLITGFEALFGWLAFQVLGGSILFAAFMGICFAGAIKASAHVLPFLLRKVSSKQGKTATAIGMSIGMLLLFYAIGYMRSVYVGEQGLIDIHPFIFMLINAVLFAIAWGIVWTQFPTKEEKDEMRAFKEKAKTLRKEESALEKMEQEINNLESGFKRDMEVELQMKGYAQSLQDELEESKKESIGKYKSANLLAREDGVVPECFTNGSESWKPEDHIQEF